MDRIAPGFSRDPEQLLCIHICRRTGAIKRHCLIRLPGMKRVSIVGRKDADRANSELCRCSCDTDCDLTTVCNEQPGKAHEWIPAWSV
jgi:hypothetical protein